MEALKSPASPKSPPPQTLEQPPAPHQGDGPAVQKDACAGASGRPAIAAQFVPPLMPHLVPPSAPHLVPPPSAPHLVPPPRQLGPGASIPPRPPKAATASAPCWLPQTQGPLWYTNVDDLNPEAWGVDSHPPGGFLGFFKNMPSLSQAVSNGTSSQQIKKGDATNGGECAGLCLTYILWRINIISYIHFIPGL
ncbi:hypothetical protein VPH35_088640 [Triticum aestivum]